MEARVQVCRWARRGAGAALLALLLVAPTAASAQGYYPTFVPVGRVPVAVAAGDLNGDGLADIATSDLGDDNVALLYQLKGGGFQDAQFIGDLPAPGGLLIGDVDGTGPTEIAVASVVAGQADLCAPSEGSVFIVTPPEFEQRVVACVLSAPAGIALSVAEAGRILASANSETASVTVLASAQGYVREDLLAGRDPSDVTGGDFNGDGFPDVASTNEGDGSVSVFLDLPSGWPRTDIAVGPQPAALVSGNLDGDQNLDLVSVSPAEGSVSLLYQRQIGTFSRKDVNVAGAAADVALGDLNGDELTDVVTVGEPNDLTTLVQRQGGGFQRTDYSVTGEPTAVALGDFGPGKELDIAVTLRFGAVEILMSQDEDATSCAGGTPTVLAEPDDETIRGTSRADVIVGSDRANSIRALGGDDRVCAGDGDDIVVGGSGDDRLGGQDGDDALRGGRGADRCRGHGGRDDVRACER